MAGGNDIADFKHFLAAQLSKLQRRINNEHDAVVARAVANARGTLGRTGERPVSGRTLEAKLRADNERMGAILQSLVSNKKMFQQLLHSSGEASELEYRIDSLVSSQSDVDDFTLSSSANPPPLDFTSVTVTPPPCLSESRGNKEQWENLSGHSSTSVPAESSTLVETGDRTPPNSHTFNRASTSSSESLRTVLIPRVQKRLGIRPPDQDSVASLNFDCIITSRQLHQSVSALGAEKCSADDIETVMLHLRDSYGTALAAQEAEAQDSYGGSGSSTVPRRKSTNVLKLTFQRTLTTKLSTMPGLPRKSGSKQSKDGFADVEIEFTTLVNALLATDLRSKLGADLEAKFLIIKDVLVSDLSFIPPWLR